MYDLQELYEDLPCSLIDLARLAGINEVTVARIRNGEPTRISTANKLLRAMSKVYGRPDNQPLTLRQVTGINVRRNLRKEKQEARREAMEQQNRSNSVA